MWQILDGWWISKMWSLGEYGRIEKIPGAKPSDTPSGFNLYYQEVKANTASTAFLRLMGS